MRKAWGSLIFSTIMRASGTEFDAKVVAVTPDQGGRVIVCDKIGRGSGA